MANIPKHQVTVSYTFFYFFVFGSMHKSLGSAFHKRRPALRTVNLRRFKFDEFYAFV